jgi:hypothetical protein
MADGDREVLSSLPRTRPERRSAKRGTRTPAGAAAANVRAAGPSKPKTAKPRAKPQAKSKAAPPRQVPPSGYAVPKTGSPVSSGGTELVGTAIQALGELANLGLSLSNRALRDVLGRLPKA